MYGRGIASIADQIKGHDGPVTKEDIQKAEDLTNKFFTSYPEAKQWIDNTHASAYKNGYVEDLWGRRRRLPNLRLDEFEIGYTDNKLSFNPLLGSSGINPNYDKKKLDKYMVELKNHKSKKDVNEIKDRASKEGIWIKDNGGYIAEAERQSVNARIQGGAASMTKKALISLYHDPEMQRLGWRTLFPVHDEIIGECPIENVEACKERLSYLMVNAAKPECTIPMKCDADSFTAWYLDVYSSEVMKQYNKLIDSGKSDFEAFLEICDSREECLPAQIRAMIDNNK